MDTRNRQEIINAAQLAFHHGALKERELSKQFVSVDGKDIRIVDGNVTLSDIYSDELMKLVDALGDTDTVHIRASYCLAGTNDSGVELDLTPYEGENFWGGVDATFKRDALVHACLAGQTVELIATHDGHTFINRVLQH